MIDGWVSLSLVIKSAVVIDGYIFILSPQSFARYMFLAGHRYCLNHLFTEMADKTSTLGLAYINQLCSEISSLSYFWSDHVTRGSL